MLFLYTHGTIVAPKKVEVDTASLSNIQSRPTFPQLGCFLVGGQGGGRIQNPIKNHPLCDAVTTSL